MLLQLLGTVAATSDDGTALDIGPAKCQAVLAVLALHPKQAVPVSRIVELVWGEQPPRTADKTLQSYVTRLRKGLGASTISRVGAAYRLETDPTSIDAARFRAAIDSGNTQDALAHWSGEPLAGLRAPALASFVEGLTEQWLTAVEAELDDRVEHGDQQVIAELRQLTAAHPFREQLWALLMRSLYQTGRQAEALAAYRTARGHLVEELGIEPGTRLRELEAQILGHDSLLETSTSRDSGPNHPSGTVTFGFTEVRDASALWTTHRADMTIAMGHHDKILQRASDASDGYVFETGGDTFCIAFHRASDAQAWALKVQEGIASQDWPRNLAIRIGIGLHSGEPEERRSRYFGPAVNTTKALAAIANGNQCIVSNSTAALLGPGELEPLGGFRIDGSTIAQQLYQLGNTQHPILQVQKRSSGNLPLRSSRLFGRAEELEAIEDALDSQQVVTLVGPGGIGKTRLALAAGHRDSTNRLGGVWFVELAELTQPEDVLRSVARVLNVSEGLGRTLFDSVALELERRPSLLVLDNCEHLLDGVAAFVRRLLDGCPTLRVLNTSREGLGVEDERLIAVSSLAPAGPAVELFIDRALAASPSFQPEPFRADIEEICRRLDGMPLAIELAAARTRSLNPDQLVERLGDRLRLLTGGRRGTVERHRTLRATIQWSYDLLSVQEQKLFGLLSIFAGPFTLEAAQEIATSPLNYFVRFDVDELLGGLVDRSMAVAESGPLGRRFRILETMRQFGAERQPDLLQANALAAKHAAWCLAEVRSIDSLLGGNDEIEGTERLNELWPNLRAAFDWACTEGDDKLAHELLKPVAPEIGLRSNAEVGDWVVRLLQIASPDNVDAQMFSLHWISNRCMLVNDSEGFERFVSGYRHLEHPLLNYAQAYAHDDDELLVRVAPAALTHLRQAGESRSADLLDLTSIIGPRLALGQFDEFNKLVIDKIAHYQQHGPPTLLHWSLFMRGFSASFTDQEEVAQDYYSQAMGIDLPQGSVSLSRPIEARAALERGDRERSFRIMRDYLDELLTTDNLVIGALACRQFVFMMTQIGRDHDAAAIYGHLLNNTHFSTTMTYAAGDRPNATWEDNSDPKLLAAQSEGATFDARRAIIYMRDVFSGLLA